LFEVFILKQVDKAINTKLLRKSSSGINEFFPRGIYDILKPYWEGELSRLVNPLPDLQTVFADLRVTLGFLNALSGF
jgi:hypothetical protein